MAAPAQDTPPPPAVALRGTSASVPAPRVPAPARSVLLLPVPPAADTAGTPVPGRSLPGDSPVGLGRSWRLLSRHIPTNERAGRDGCGQTGPQPGRAPTARCVPRVRPSTARSEEPRPESREVPGPTRVRGGRAPGKPASLGPSPRDSPLTVAALQLSPALGPALPLAHLRAPRASRSPPASPHRTSRESSSLGDLKVSARSPKSLHTV